MAILKLKIPDGHFCKDCNYLMKPDTKKSGSHICRIFECVLGNKLTNIFKCPMCIEQEKNGGTVYRDKSSTVDTP